MQTETQNQSSFSDPPSSAGEQTKSTVITQELVMAIADRIYARLIHEMKIAQERERFLFKSRPRQGGF